MAEKQGRTSATLGSLGSSLGSSADLYKMPSARYGRGEQQSATQPQQAPQNSTAPSQNVFQTIMDIVLKRRNPWWNNPNDPNIFRQTPSNPSNPIGPSAPLEPMGDMGSLSYTPQWMRDKGIMT